jgi:hypothetical protein
MLDNQGLKTPDWDDGAEEVGLILRDYPHLFCSILSDA